MKKKNSYLKTIVGIVIAVVALVLLTNPGWFPLSQETLDSIHDLKMNHFMIGKSGDITLSRVWVFLMAMCVLWLIHSVLKLVLKKYSEKDERSQMIAAMISSAVKYVFWIVGMIWGLSILGVNTTAVLAGVGIIGLVLGFGVQTLIEDIVTGVFIIFEGQYSIGDIIILDDFRGVVKSIGVRTTTIEDAGGNLKVVNNSDIRNFQNRSKHNSLAISEPSVAYGTSMQKLEKVMKESLPAMLEKHPDLYLSVPRYLGVVELGDSGITVRVVADVKEENVFVAQRQLNRDLYVLFSEAGIEIPFPQIVVHQGD